MKPIKNSRLRKRILLLVFPLFLSAPRAQVEPEEAEVITLNLFFEETIGQVGQEISFPIKLFSSAPVKEPFQVILRFPPSKLEYVKLGVADGPRNSGWKLTPELRKSPPAFDMHFLEILAEPGEGDFLPAGGDLAFAFFRVLEADTEHAIELAPSIKQLGEAPLEVEAEPAEITALPEGTFACFFYLH